MDTAALFLIAVLVMLIGLLGTVVPGVPGIPLVWVGALGFAMGDRFQHLPLNVFLVLTLLAMVGTSAGLWATNLFARAGGASGCSALLGTCLAALGLIFFTLPIALLLALAGVFGIEWRRRGEAKRAAIGSAGWLLGWGLATLLEFFIALAMVLTIQPNGSAPLF
jgi:uncharacterized protein YqgC (DUF456 family)